MPEWPRVALFVAAATALIVIPGPAVFYLLARSDAHKYAMRLVGILPERSQRLPGGATRCARAG